MARKEEGAKGQTDPFYFCSLDLKMRSDSTCFFLAAGLFTGASATSTPVTMAAFVAESSSKFAFDPAFTTPSAGDLGATFADCQGPEVLVHVVASSVNPCDKGTDAARTPKPLGSDIAGVVVATSGGGSRLRVGDRVYGDIGANAHLVKGGAKTKELGAFAEYAVALESQVAVFPNSVGFTEAGSLPKVALTSYKALGWYAGGANATSPAAPAGKPDPSLWASKPTVLVLGGSGGTGTCGVQLAKIFGAGKIISTTSKDNFAYVKSLGADELIDFESSNWWDPSVVADDSVDVVYDTVGQFGTGNRALSKIRTGGHYVTITGSMPSKRKAGVTADDFINSDTNLDNFGLLDTLAGYMAAGTLRMPHIDSSFGLQDVKAAFARSATGKVVGKVSIAVANASTTALGQCGTACTKPTDCLNPTTGTCEWCANGFCGGRR